MCRVSGVGCLAILVRLRAGARSTPPLTALAVEMESQVPPFDYGMCPACRSRSLDTREPPGALPAAPAAHPGLKSKPKKQKLRYRQYTALYRLHFFGARTEKGDFRFSLHTGSQGTGLTFERGYGGQARNQLRQRGSSTLQ